MELASVESPIAERVAALVQNLLTQRGLGPVSASQNLRDAGLKSMDVFNLMLAVEGAFDTVIPEQDMTPDNFRSIGSILVLVSRLA
jgi:acyl carrier protein